MKLVLNLMLAVSLVSIVGIENSGAGVLKSIEKDIRRNGRNIDKGLRRVGRDSEDAFRRIRDSLSGERARNRVREADEAQRAAQGRKEAAERERQILITQTKEQLELLDQNLQMNASYTNILESTLSSQKSLLNIVEAELQTRVQVKEYMVRALVYMRDMNENNFDLMALFFSTVEKSSDSIKSANENIGDMQKSLQDIEQSKISLDTIKLAAESQGKTLDLFLSEAIRLVEKSDLEKVYIELSYIVTTSENLLGIIRQDYQDKLSRKDSLLLKMATLDLNKQESELKREAYIPVSSSDDSYKSQCRSTPTSSPEIIKADCWVNQ